VRALASIGIFSRSIEGTVSLTPGAEPLLHDSPESIRTYAILWGEQLYAAAGALFEQCEGDATGFQIAHGERIWDFYRNRPADSDVFDSWMNAATQLQVSAITQSHDFSRYKCVVDVGAGRGALLAAILCANPMLRGVWYDRPELQIDARRSIETAGVADRCELLNGNFLDNVPAGADLYTIKHVLHDWDDDAASRIIANIAKAMGSNSTLLILEAVLDERDGKDAFVKMRDLEQMFWTGGRVRSQAAFERVLRPSGLMITKISTTSIVDVRVIEVVKENRNAARHASVT
jgi:tRNA A58 N-methylase Trm61